MKQHRVIYNQDCTDLFCITREPLTPAHVDRMVDEVADGGADVFLVNPNAQRVNYPSKVWQTFWDGHSPADRSFFRLVSPEEVETRELWISQMKRLVDEGCDYLERSLSRCRERGIVPGVTVRMNDMHDAPKPGTHLFSRFYIEHPEYRLQNDSFCAWGAIGLNYERLEVREHYLALIRELVYDYDFDVLELDFLRFHCYFPRNDFAKHCATMTDFVREVRGIADKSGRRIKLLVRVAATPAAAYELGLDIETWAREHLVDGISAGAFLNTQWRIPIADFRGVVGDDMALYVCLDYTADRRPGLPVRTMPDNPDLLRGFAAGHLAAGADGIELFNFFVTREEAHVRHRADFPDDEVVANFDAEEYESRPAEPSFATLREVRDLDSLRGTGKTYTLTSGWAVAETDGVVQIPVKLERGEVRSFQLFVAAEPADSRVEAVVMFTGGAETTVDQLWLHVNHMTAGHAKSIAIRADLGADIRRAVFRVPTQALRDGHNELVLRNEGGEAAGAYTGDPTSEAAAIRSERGSMIVISIDVVVRNP